MPAYYEFRCDACGKVTERYRNVKRSRCCRATVTRLEPPSQAAQLRARVEELGTEVVTLRTLLGQAAVYGRHHDDCLGKWFYGSLASQTCSCGWASVERQLACLGHAPIGESASAPATEGG